MDDISSLELALRLILAVGLGTLLGLERESRNKSVGARTHALVALGAAGFAISGAFGVEDRDATRVAAQVVSGIGFIGAGVIVQGRGSVTGITTAATLWVAASLGLISAFGLYTLALVAGAATLFIVLALGKFTPFLLSKRQRRFNMRYRTGSGTLAPLFESVATGGGQIREISLQESDGVREVEMMIHAMPDDLIDQAVALLADRDEVLEVSAGTPPVKT